VGIGLGFGQAEGMDQFRESGRDAAAGQLSVPGRGKHPPLDYSGPGYVAGAGWPGGQAAGRTSPCPFCAVFAADAQGLPAMPACLTPTFKLGGHAAETYIGARSLAGQAWRLWPVSR
jgi:hypothetical protein